MSCKARILSCIVVLLLVAPFAALAGMGGSKMLNPGVVAPDFEFTDTVGQKGSLYKAAEGKPLLLVFVQTSCRSCQREMAFIKELQDKGSNIEILVVFVDLKQRDFVAFAKENGLPFRFLWDSDYKVADAYGVAFTTASFLLDGERKVAKVYRGWTGSGTELIDDLKSVGVTVP
jgi:peroxiredoxin